MTFSSPALTEVFRRLASRLLKAGGAAFRLFFGVSVIILSAQVALVSRIPAAWDPFYFHLLPSQLFFYFLYLIFGRIPEWLHQQGGPSLGEPSQLGGEAVC